MSEHRTERLSAYIDGELTATERETLEAHLARCVECAGVLADLRGIVAEAATLEDRMPERDLWPAIAARIGARIRASVDREVVVTPLAPRRRLARRFSFTVPQLAAAALALIVLSGGLVWLERPGGGAGRERAEAPPASSNGTAEVLPVSTDPRGGYAEAAAELERVFKESRDRLHPETVRTVESNLAIIDAAIAQTVEALEADPNSIYLYNHLTSTRQRKLEVLRDAASIVQVSL